MKDQNDKSTRVFRFWVQQYPSFLGLRFWTRGATGITFYAFGLAICAGFDTWNSEDMG